MSTPSRKKAPEGAFFNLPTDDEGEVRVTHDECLCECRRRMKLVTFAIQAGKTREATVQRIAMYASMSARNAASNGAVALDFLDDQAWVPKGDSVSV